jgi:hypothetical protein
MRWNERVTCWTTRMDVDSQYGRCPLLVSIVGGVAAKLGEEEVAVFNTSYR